MNNGNFFSGLSWLDRVIEFIRFRCIRRYIPQDGIVVDLGAGQGSFLKSIENYIKRGFALDRYSSEWSLGKITFIPFDLDTDTLKNPSLLGVDAVIALAVIEHVWCPERLVKAAFHMLRPGGFFILTTPTPRARWLLELLALRLGLTNKKSLLEHRQYLWGYQLYTLAKDAGFKSAEWHEFELGMNTLLVAVK